MLNFFNRRWDSVPLVFVDTETTGVRPGFDRAVQIGIARFESGKLVRTFTSFVNPHMPIPAEASSIHGIADRDVAGAPTVDELFARPEVKGLLEGAQAGAYNASFDRYFVPPFGSDWTWPWVDSLSLVRDVDRFARGAGRHKLEAACKRHGIELSKAHDAGSDAGAAGRLYYKLGAEVFGSGSLGDAIRWQCHAEADSWHNFNSWLSKQPPREPVDHRPAFDREARHG